MMFSKTCILLVAKAHVLLHLILTSDKVSYFFILLSYNDDVFLIVIVVEVTFMA